VGDEVLLDKIKGKPGDEVQIERVIFLGGGEKSVLHREELSKAKVKAVIAEQLRGEKIVTFKYKPKKGYRCKRGHRQLLTKVRIEEINFGEKRERAAEKKVEGAKPGAPKGEVKPEKKIETEKTKGKTKVVEKTKKAGVSTKESAKGVTSSKTRRAEPKGKK
jgi:large subunit ribosomal protein L21